MTFSLDNGRSTTEVVEPCSLQSGLGQDQSLIGDCLESGKHDASVSGLQHFFFFLLQYVCVCVLAWSLPLLNKPATHKVCSLCVLAPWISHPLILSPLQLRYWRGSRRAESGVKCWGRTLYTLAVDFAFQSNVNMSYLQAEHLNYSLSFWFLKKKANREVVNAPAYEWHSVSCYIYVELQRDLYLHNDTMSLRINALSNRIFPALWADINELLMGSRVGRCCCQGTVL